MAHEQKVHKGAMRASHESHKRSHEHEDMGDDAAPWGHGKFANMPDSVEMYPYPKQKMGRSRGIDDTMRRIDGEDDQMEGKRSKYVSDQH